MGENQKVVCTHNDCFTCPYNECISNKEPVKQKRGRKPLPPEERKKRRRAYNNNYNKEHSEYFHEKYIERTEGKVKRRYKQNV